MSKIEVDAIEPQSGTSLTIGASGDTVTVPSGVTLDTSNSTLTLPDNSVTTNKIADSNITLAKLSATGTKDATTFLRGDNTFASAGGTNTPAFFAYVGSTQTISNSTWTKVQFDTEVYDTNSTYDNSTNYRFTPTTAGKYHFFARVEGAASATNDLRDVLVQVHKNGSIYMYNNFTFYPDYIAHNFGVHVIGDVDMNGTTDYLEIFCYISANTGTPSYQGASQFRTYFGAHKLII